VFDKFLSKKKRRFLLMLILYVGISSYYFCLPKKLFKTPYATVITSKEGSLLGAKIAKDDQWRFPSKKIISKELETCVLLFEDEYFYKHPSFNPVAIFKAIKHNFKSDHKRIGASTITQQVIRLSRNGKARTYFEKLIELLLATRLELSKSKNNILNLYLSHAPFGGNIVGVQAASWRYFNKAPENLTWSQSATLAVLPNAPGLIYPGKNKKHLLEKRNRLLKKLLTKNKLDSLTYRLSIAEPLPEKPYPIPQIAPHFLQKIALEYEGKQLQTSIDVNVQEKSNAIIARHYQTLKLNNIHNAALLILDVKTRKVISYVGNTPTNKSNQNQVDVINKPRSTGSILKPFLYAAMLDSGELLPESIVEDIPTHYGSYTPKNFNNTFSGAVSAKKALSQSLNVPAVRLLQKFGKERFYDYLKKLHLSDLKYGSSHYGLSLVLGGAESNLWDLCKSYAAMSGTLQHFNEKSSRYYSNEFCEPSVLKHKSIHFGELKQHKIVFNASSIYHTFESMKQVNRPTTEESWRSFNSSQPIAWKTGTSFGFRDAWAIGVTKDFVVGIWVGNADGEGRPGLVGLEAAAPILFDVFDMLPKSEWFQKPYDDLSEVLICNNSGYRASPFCENPTYQFIPQTGLRTESCPYHKQVHLSLDEKYRVNTSCEYVANIKMKSWFVLPPLQAYFYQKNNPSYLELPPYKPKCKKSSKVQMAFIYPNANNKIFLPKDFNENTNDIILKVAHSKPELELFWYLDHTFLGATKTFHDLAIKPVAGPHKITVLDELGNSIETKIHISQ